MSKVMSYVVQSRRSIRAQNQLLKMVSDANAAGASRCRQEQKRGGAHLVKNEGVWDIIK